MENSIGIVVLGLCCVATVLLVIWGIYAFAKNNNTFKQRLKINEAIYNYNLRLLDGDIYEYFIDQEIVMEDYDETYNRWWDWGCTRIVPPIVYAVIKPYIEKEKLK